MYIAVHAILSRSMNKPTRIIIRRLLYSKLPRMACPQTPLGGHALHAIKLSWPDHFVGACYGLGIARDVLCTYLLLQEIRFSHSNIVTYSNKVHDLRRGHVVSAKAVKGIHKTP